MQNILVVGGAGYIGSHMVQLLKQAGYRPIVLDDLSHGYAHAVIDAELIIGNMGDKVLLDQLFATRDIEAVMHFGSYIDIAESVKDPAKYYHNNVINTLYLLDAMLQYKIKPFIFSSSAAVYGEPQSVPIDEKHPLQPINPYGRSKLMVEEILQDYAATNKLHYGILRYFNAAGADPKGELGECHEPETHLIPIVLEVAAGKRDKLIINGNDYDTHDGTCIRDYVHVMDICNAHLQALKFLLDKNESFICNLGSGKGCSVQEIVNAVEAVTKKQIPIHYGLRRLGDPAILIAKIDRANQLLNWQPCYSDIHAIVNHAWQFMSR